MKIYNYLEDVWSGLPWFKYFFLDVLGENDLEFKSDENLMYSTIPILIIHGTEDLVVPFFLGQQLYKKIQNARDTWNIRAPIAFTPIDKGAHNDLYMFDGMSIAISKFLNEAGNHSV